MQAPAAPIRRIDGNLDEPAAFQPLKSAGGGAVDRVERRYRRASAIERHGQVRQRGAADTE
jgi:hypothetical protein